MVVNTMEALLIESFHCLIKLEGGLIMKLSIEELVKRIETSTGIEEVFDFESVNDRLIELSLFQKKLETAITILKNSCILHKERYPYENEEGRVTLEIKGKFEQDIQALFKVLPREAFLQAAKIEKSKLSEDKEELKKLKALVEIHTNKVGETSFLKVVAAPVKKDESEKKLKVR